MSDPIIAIENLSKRYLIGHLRARRDGIRHVLEDALRSPVAWLRSRTGQQRLQKAEFWALKDVSFQIKQGEVLGIIGRNGAGKSTLLKILSRITEPTEGRVRIQGRVASLLEVGTGFHQELTGRENIFLNGAILGMTRAEIISRFDEIVAFSEIEQFLDTPVKRYSSGMYVRLAFAVAAHLEPEILIVDEVLAVGDAAFQRKCLGKMGSFARSGKTVIFVSHNMEGLGRLCQRGILLGSGVMLADGPIEEVLQTYERGFPEVTFRHENQDYGLTIDKVVLKNSLGVSTREFCPGEDLAIEVLYTARKRVEKPYFVLIVQGVQGSCFTANMLLDGNRPEVLEGSGGITCIFKSIPLLPQRYVVKMAIQATISRDAILDQQEVGGFSVIADLEKYGYKGEFQMLASRSTPVVVPYEWRLPDGSNAQVSLRRSVIE